MRIDLRRLGYALTVARTRSFSRAAKQLVISQPALSRSIASLEADLNVRLFDRGRGGVTITPSGKALIADAEQLISRARMLEQSITQWRSGHAGVVSFGIEPVPASAFLPSILVEIARTRPHLVAHVLVAGPDEIVRALETDSIEFGVCAEPSIPTQRNLKRSVIGDITYGLFVRAGHPLLKERRPGRDDLARFPIASGALPTGSAQDNWVARLCEPNIFCENYHVLKEATLASDIIWLSSPLLLTRELHDRAMVELPLGLAEKDRTVSLCAIRLSKGTPSPVMAELVELMARLMAPSEPEVIIRSHAVPRRRTRSRSAQK